MSFEKDGFIHIQDYMLPIIRVPIFLILTTLLLSLAACTLLQNKTVDSSDCKKESLKKLKKLKKYFHSTNGGVYTYLYQDVSVPKGFETIFWERKIGREYAVSIQLSDTMAMQFLQLPLSLQDIIYGECDNAILEEELISHLGPPTYTSKSLLPNAKQSLVYSFNKPEQNDCFHGEYMGNVAYQDCLSITMDIDSRGRVVELNTSSFDVGQ